MQITQFESYTDALNAVFAEEKRQLPSLTLSSLAQQCLMQPSYLTNVLKERADLNSDQLYRLCELLRLDGDDTEYLLMLLELKRTQYSKRRNELQAKIRKIQSEQLRAEKNILTPSTELTAEQAEKYYLDPYIQLIHIYLTIPQAKKTLAEIARKFAIPLRRAEQVLQTLEEIHYVQRKAKNYEVLNSGRHLPRESAILRPHQQMLRLKSLEQMQSLTVENVYSFSATISTSPEARTQIQAEYLKFLKSAEKIVKGSEPERLYQINFDLFPWEKDLE